MLTLRTVPGPVRLYTCPVGTAKPSLASKAALPNTFSPVGGANGEEHYEGAVALNISRATREILDSRFPQPSGRLRTGQTSDVSVSLRDLTMETLGLIMGKAVTETAAGSGVRGVKSLDLTDEWGVETGHGVLIRGNTSAYIDTPEDELGDFDAWQVFISAANVAGTIGTQLGARGYPAVAVRFLPYRSGVSARFVEVDMVSAAAT